jgi:nitrogen fixation/metabolism regulation signal transduction histidine kinase
MAGPFSQRRKILPEFFSVLIIYALTALGAVLYAQSVLAEAPDFPGLYERLPALLLAVLPGGLLALLVLRARTLALELRARRYGSRLKLRLSLLFALAIVAAALPEGAFLLRIANIAQASSSSQEIRDALSQGQALALDWYDEELDRVERAADSLAQDYDANTSKKGARGLLASLKDHDPRMEALELFSAGKSVDFAGTQSAKLASPPSPPSLRSGGHLLAASSSGETSVLRYAVPLALHGESFAVLTLRLPADLDKTAASLGKAARTAGFLVPFSLRWAKLLALLYGFLVLPLLLIAVLLGTIAADLVAEPLVSLEEATRRVAAGDFGVRLIVKPGDETGRLIASFNRMLSEISRSREGELRKEKIDAWKDIAQRLAHELKNPLTPIRLTAERVLRRWKTDPEQVSPIIANSMLAIIKEVEGMDALLTDFRAFASLPEPERDWVKLTALVSDSVAVYVASYPDVKFKLDGLPEDLTLRVDRAAMKRALGNLITNAIDAMDGTGDIEIGADLVKAADSRYCRLKIRDTGRGIPSELCDKVFMPYFTTKSSGTGLGLSIVERIVSEHGGSLRFESEEGAGTTFFLDLPLDR